MPRIDRTQGRQLFGADPAAYDLGRPGHSPLVYEVLVERCGLGPGTSVIEVGPGTGQATRRLLELGADPIVVVEPNPSLAEYLEERYGDRLELVRASLEEAELEPNRFDLAAAASSFHWVDERALHASSRSCGRAGGARSGGHSSETTARRTRSSPRPALSSMGSTRARQRVRRVVLGTHSTASAVCRHSSRRGSSTSSTSSRAGKRGGMRWGHVPSTAASHRSSRSTRPVGRRSWTRSHVSRRTSSTGV